MAKKTFYTAQLHGFSYNAGGQTWNFQKLSGIQGLQEFRRCEIRLQGSQNSGFQIEGGH